jgi:DNA-binding NarL/FixJ family response regulator
MSGKQVPKPALLGSPSSDLTAVRFRVGMDEYAVLSYRLPSNEPPATLSASERSVYRALLAGHGNAAIAEQRGRSLRTVANQVASIFAKLGVGSRAELLAGQFGAPRVRLKRSTR